MDISVIFGIVGLLIILVAFALNLFHFLSPKSKVYNWMNILGSVLLGIYALYLRSIPFFVLQIIWALLSLIKLFHIHFFK